MDSPDIKQLKLQITTLKEDLRLVREGLREAQRELQEHKNNLTKVCKCDIKGDEHGNKQK